MGQKQSILDQDYDNLINILDEITYGWKTIYECECILKDNTDLINIKAPKLVKEDPALIIKLIKIYPEAKVYLFEILGKENIKNISHKLDEYNL